ncbi:MAG: ATP-binding protein [Ilumatobacteraceae bacterium]|nr:ATP-binding protein [Ilumatobacteraceae bacterium]
MACGRVDCETRGMHRAGLSFRRRDDGRVVAGLAGGFADQHGVHARVVRGALVVLAFAGGVGLVVYALLALLAEPAAASAVGAVGDVGAPHPRDQRRDAAVGFVTLGLVVLVRSTNVWLGDPVMVPLIIIVAGVVVLGVFGDRAGVDVRRSPLAAATDMLSGRNARARVLIGSALIAAGLIWVGAGRQVSGDVRTGIIATAASVLGVAVLLAPWLTRLAQDASDERRQRVRSEERAAMAEHLHDSVLQTLALIQRSADDPRRTITLARQQEHELRTWLYGDRSDGAATLSTAVDDLVAEVEARHDVPIERVVVGDRPMDADLVAFCGALREACVNASRHSGAEVVAVYVEVLADAVDGFVRDRGRGFDAVAARHPGRDGAHRGISQSIEARMERIGGSSRIDSTPGEGTEVHLRVPLHVDAERERRTSPG